MCEKIFQRGLSGSSETEPSLAGSSPTVLPRDGRLLSSILLEMWAFSTGQRV